MHPVQAVTAHRSGLVPTFAPPVPGIRGLRVLLMPCMPHIANAGYWQGSGDASQEEIPGSTPGLATFGSSLVEQPRKRSVAGSIPAHGRKTITGSTGRKTTRRTRGEAPRLRSNRKGFTPSAGGGLCQHPAQPAPAASRAAALPAGMGVATKAHCTAQAAPPGTPPSL
jgi:hypothetical protein